MNGRSVVTSANLAALCLLDIVQLSSTVVKDIRDKPHSGQFQMKVMSSVY